MTHILTLKRKSRCRRRRIQSEHLRDFGGRLFRNLKVYQIAAMARNRAIGIHGKLPWHIPEDLKFFKEKTQGHVMIMGRKTFESIGKRVLPKRMTIVVSRGGGEDAPNLRYATIFEGALAIAADEIAKGSWAQEIMVVGGGEVYRQALPWSDRIYLTEVDVDVADGDAFFPMLPPDFQASHRDIRQGEPGYTFVTYERDIGGA